MLIVEKCSRVNFTLLWYLKYTNPIVRRNGLVIILNKIEGIPYNNTRTHYVSELNRKSFPLLFEAYTSKNWFGSPAISFVKR